MDETDLQSAVPTRERGFSRYLWLVLAIPCVLYVLPLLLMRVPSYERWGGSLFGPALDFAFHADGQNADVVLFGDSSAMYGISPLQMTAALGVKTINLPNSGGSLPLTGEIALQRYLAHNKPPRLLVFYLSPWDLDYANDPNPFLFESEELLARNGTPGEIAAYFKQHPWPALAFPLQVYTISPRASLPALLHHEDRPAAIRATMGHVDTVASHPHLDGSCAYTDEIFRESGFASVEALIARYRSPATRVLVYVSPIPHCVNFAPVVNRPYASIPADPPRVMPAALFMDDAQYVHLDPSAVPEATRSLIDAVRPLLTEGASAAP